MIIAIVTDRIVNAGRKRSRAPWREGEGNGEPTRGGCAREDVMKRNPSVGRKLPVTWLRQHAIVSGIIKHIGSIYPWKRNTLSPRAIQGPSIDLCPPDRSVYLIFVCVYRNVAPIRSEPTLSQLSLDRGSVTLKDRTGRRAASSG